MSFLYWLFGVERGLRESLPSLSVHDDGFNRGWTFVLALLALLGLLWLYHRFLPRLPLWQGLVLAGLRWVFLSCVLFLLVRPVLILSGEQSAGLPEVAKVDLAVSPWILAVMLGLLASEWGLKKMWRVQ